MTRPRCSDPAIGIALALATALSFASTLAQPVETQTVERENSLGMRFVAVPGTTVAFSVWITRVRDFAEFVQATGYDATAGVMSMTLEGGQRIGKSWKDPGFAQDEDHPACGLNFDDAHAFCAWLTEKERATGQLRTTERYRLPTDAEWSIAVGLPAEGDGSPEVKSDKIVARYPWGETWPPADNTANYAGEEARTGIWPAAWGVLEGYRDRHARTAPVGSYAANAFGLYDLGGNVWQWCETPGRATDQPQVLRGASFLSHFQNELLSSHRFAARDPHSRGIFFGFRCVIEDSAPTPAPAATARQ